MRSLLLVALAACGSGQAEAVKTAPPPDHARVVMISIDGMMPETYMEPDRLGLKVPTLRKLRAQGAFAHGVQSVFPTVTYPAHTTMVTGVPPAVHGITSNRSDDPLDKNAGGWHWYAEEIERPTLWESVQHAGREAAVITWPVTVGAEAAYRVPEYWRAGTPDDQKLLRSLATPGLLDKVEKQYPELWKSLVPPDVKDDAQFAIAKYVLANAHPDLLLMHVWSTDDAQHEHGPRSPEAKAAFEAVDAKLGELLATLEASPQWDNTLVLVVSDHGFAPVDHEINLDVLFAQAGLIDITDGKSTAARAHCIANGGTAYVYAEDAAARDKALAVVGELGAKASVIDAVQIQIMGGDPNAAFAVAAAPGYAFGTKRTGPAIVPSKTKGNHGYPPADPNMQASFLATGGLVRARDLGTIQMVDIEPTVAHWLGLGSVSTGKVIDLATR